MVVGDILGNARFVETEIKGGLMKTGIKSVIAIMAVVFLAGCCLRFSDLTANTQYHVGDEFATSGTTVKVEQFQWGNGIWNAGGFAEVDGNNYAQGSGNAARAGGVNLNFKFNYPADSITLKFGELGGNNNIRINGEFKNVRDFIDINNTTIGGVLVKVSAVQQGSNWYGSIELDGNIDDFAIGGQELWLDDVCCD
jgi:hypothetical protein